MEHYCLVLSMLANLFLGGHKLGGYKIDCGGILDTERVGLIDLHICDPLKVGCSFGRGIPSQTVVTIVVTQQNQS